MTSAQAGCWLAEIEQQLCLTALAHGKASPSRSRLTPIPFTQNEKRSEPAGNIQDLLSMNYPYFAFQRRIT
jgi:hypothetical protein